MTLEDIKKTRDQIKCYWCDSIISHFDGRFIAIFSQDGAIIIKGRDGQPRPMVYCSSDCMVYDCNIRYHDRVTKGTFRKQFDQKYNDERRIPESWKEDPIATQTRAMFENHQ